MQACIDTIRAKKSKRAFLIYATILILCCAASAQNLGGLTGTVINAETRESLEGASVTVKTTNLAAATDRQGRYMIARIPAGSYTLLFSSVGYADVEIAGLRTEGVPVAGDMSSAYGSARLDRDFSSGAVLTMESGLA